MSNTEDPQPTASSPENGPLELRHGRRLLEEIVTTRRDVVATKSDTAEILTLLAPGEENPVLEILAQILHTQRQLVAQMEHTEQSLKKLGEQVTLLRRE